MTEKQLDEYICAQSVPLKSALAQMDHNGRGILFVTDDEKRLIGTLTDGDIRRWSIKYGSFPKSIGDVMGSQPKYLKAAERDFAIEYMQKKRIRAVPIVDSDVRIIDVIFNSRIYDDIGKSKNSTALNEMPVIIMAGGKGTRLWPYTKILPKPLIPIDDIPIIERIMNRLSAYGANTFYITVNYRKEMIKAYFADMQVPYSISYIEEDKPLGTAGSLGLLGDNYSQYVLVTNCDILAELDYEDLLMTHRAMKRDMTVVTAHKKITIPYGVIHSSEGGVLERMEEKPQIDMDINTGMYVINTDMLSYIPENEAYNMTDLIEALLRENRCVGTYIIDENDFLDMGEFSEMHRMEERLSE